MGKPDEDEGVVIARTVLRPTVQAAVTLKEYGKSYGISIYWDWPMRLRFRPKRCQRVICNGARLC